MTYYVVVGVDRKGEFKRAFLTAKAAERHRQSILGAKWACSEVAEWNTGW